ncbi:MAG: hypothetical protein ACSNEK_06400 [Parachlamydiaceae bacterium]
MGFDIRRYELPQGASIDSSLVKGTEQTPSAEPSELDREVHHVATSFFNNEGVKQSSGDIRHEAEELLNNLESLAKDWETMFGSEVTYNQVLDEITKDMPSQVDEKVDESQEHLFDRILGEVLQNPEQSTSEHTHENQEPKAPLQDNSPAEPLAVPSSEEKGKEKVEENEEGRADSAQSSTPTALSAMWRGALDGYPTEDASTPPLPSTERASPRVEDQLVARKRSLGFKIWRLISRLTSLVSHKKTKWISKIVIRSGLVKLEELDPEMITKLSSKWIGRVSPDQFRQLETRHFDAMSQSQLFAIGPNRLEEIGPRNMAYIVMHRLEPDAGNNFIEWIAEQSFNGEFAQESVKELFHELGEKKTNGFLRSLVLQREFMKKHDKDDEGDKISRKFAYLYRLLKGPAEFSFSSEVLQDVLEGKEDSFQKLEEKSFSIPRADGSKVSLTPIKIIVEDAGRINFMINGEQINTQVDKDEAYQLLLTAIYEGAEGDEDLVERIQYFINQGGAFGAFQEAVMFPRYVGGELEDLYVGGELEDLSDPLVGLGRRRPVIQIDIDRASNKIIIKNKITFPLTDTSNGTTFGYVKAEGEFKLPIDELKSGKIPNATDEWKVSRVYKTLKELEVGEGVHPERQVEGGYKALEKDLRSRISTDKNAVFQRKQTELEEHYSDSLALELSLQKMTYLADTRTRVRQAANQDLSIEQLREKFQNDPLALEAVNKIHAALGENAAKTGVLFDETRPLERNDISILDKVYEKWGMLVEAPRGAKYFGFMASKDQSPNALAWESDQQMVRELILKALGQYQDQGIDQEQKDKIRKEVLFELNQRIDEAKKNVIYIKKLVGTFPDTVEDEHVAYAKKKDFTYRDEFNNFREDLIKVIKAGYANARGKAKNITKPSEALAKAVVYEIPENDLQALREKYIEGQTSDGVSEILIGDIFEEVLNALSLKEYRKGQYIERYADQLIEDAMVTFFDTPVNFPDKAKALAEALLDEVLNHPLRR